MTLWGAKPPRGSEEAGGGIWSDLQHDSLKIGVSVAHLRLTKAAKTKSTAPLKLLVVEDDLASLELMSEVFASFDAEVVPVSDSRKAAVLVDKQKFDGIFLDLEMPNIDGLELARRIRTTSWNKATPIVIVTGRDERQIMHQAFSTGATFFLQKPVDRQKLRNLYKTVRGGMVENRRRHARVPLQTKVVCEIGSRTTQGVTWNLSQGGIQIEAHNQLSAGEMVRLSFRLPVTDIAIEAVGRVAWVKENRQGIQFTNVTAKNQQAIRAFVEELSEPE